MKHVVMLGTAGSGKSYLTATLASWLEDHGFTVLRVNLDPAAEWIPYSPDIDARDYVDARRLMKEKGMGPNGALVSAVDMLVSHLESLTSEVKAAGTEYVLLDTPGQMELFAFRATGPIMLNAIIGGEQGVGLFLIDPAFTSRAASMLSAMLLYYSVQARLGLPQIPVLSKSDLLDAETVEELREMLEDPLRFEERLVEEGVEPGLISVAKGLFEAYGGEAVLELVEASSRTSLGVDAVFAAIQQVLGGREEIGEEEQL